MSNTDSDPIFLVVAHTDSEMFARLTHALHPYRVVAHIDRKSSQSSFENAASPNVEFTTERVFVNWAGFSQVEAIEILFNHVRDTPASTPLVLLTGQDFPARNPVEFVETLRNNGVRQYLRSFQIASATRKYSWQVDRPHYQDIAPRFPAHIRRALIFASRATTGWRKLKAPAGVEPYHGHANWVITREVATEVQECLSRRDVRRFFKRTFAPDEKFIPTLLRSPQNEPSRWRIAEGEFMGEGNWRYTNFHYIDESLKVLTLDDLPAIRSSGQYFVRKVSTPMSVALIDALETCWKRI